MDGTVKIWDASRSQEVRTLSEHNFVVSRVAASSNGKWLSSSSWDGTAKIIDAKTGQVARTIHLGEHGQAFSHVAFRNPDHQRLYFYGCCPGIQQRRQVDCNR